MDYQERTPGFGKVVTEGGSRFPAFRLRVSRGERGRWRDVEVVVGNSFWLVVHLDLQRSGSRPGFRMALGAMVPRWRPVTGRFAHLRMRALEPRAFCVGFTELFTEAKSKNTHIIVERIVADIDDIVKKVRFPDWQRTSQGERLVQKELRKTLLKYKLHTDQDLFDRAYAYITRYY